MCARECERVCASAGQQCQQFGVRGGYQSHSLSRSPPGDAKVPRTHLGFEQQQGALDAQHTLTHNTHSAHAHDANFTHRPVTLKCPAPISVLSSSRLLSVLLARSFATHLVGCVVECKQARVVVMCVCVLAAAGCCQSFWRAASRPTWRAVSLSSVECGQGCVVVVCVQFELQQDCETN